MRQSERGFQTALFFSRWLIAPFLFGLVLCLFLLMYRFFADFFSLATHLPGLSWHDLITDVLNLIDIALTANLVITVVFSGYDNFVRNIEAAGRSDLPGSLVEVGFGALKQR